MNKFFYGAGIKYPCCRVIYRMLFKRFILLLIIFAAFFSPGEKLLSMYISDVDSVSTARDSLETDVNATDTTKKWVTGLKKPAIAEPFEMKKSPTGAIIRSIILPGWGQYYVGSYWKAPLFLGAACGLAYGVVKFNGQYQSEQSQYDWYTNNDPNNSSALNYYKTRKEYYRDQRDMMAFYLLGVYILSAVDAYVGAHLYDFTVDDDSKKSVTVEPCNGCGVSIVFRISLF